MRRQRPWALYQASTLPDQGAKFEELSLGKVGVELDMVERARELFQRLGSVPEKNGARGSNAEGWRSGG
jgi:hypothetical protein